MGLDDEYLELWQYLPRTYTSKEDGAAYAQSTSVIYGNKPGKTVDWPCWCKTHQLQYVRLGQFNFRRITELSRNGIAMCRVPQEADISIGAKPLTRFLPIDFDNTAVDGVTPDLTWDDMGRLASDRFVIMPSTSDKKKFRYHGWCLLQEPVSTKEEILERMRSLEQWIYKRIGKRVALDDSLATWSQWFYGCCQPEEREYIIDPNDTETLLLKKGEPGSIKNKPRLRVTLRPEKKKIEEAKQFRGNRVPSSMGHLALLCGVKILYGYRFHAHLPWVKKGCKLRECQISIGERYDSVKTYMCRMYNMLRLTNYQLAEHGINLKMSYEDLVETLRYNLSRACQDPTSVEKDIESLYDMLESIHLRNKDLTDEEYILKSLKYADRDAKGNLLTVYRTKTYASEVAYDVMMRYKVDDKVVFKSRKEMDAVLDAQTVKIRTFESVCAMYHLAIQCDVRVERRKETTPRNRRSKYQYMLDNLIGDTYYYNIYDAHEAQYIKDYNRTHDNKLRYAKASKLVPMRVPA